MSWLDRVVASTLLVGLAIMNAAIVIDDLLRGRK
jgi:hypothetical protein